MKKTILMSLVGLFLMSGCTQIKGSFDPNKIVKYSNEISLATKYVVKFALKNENLTKEQLIQVKYYLVLAQQTINFDKQVVFSNINTLMENRIQDPTIKSIVKIVLVNVEKYVDSYNLQLTPENENVRKITLAALDGALSAVNELLET